MLYYQYEYSEYYFEELDYACFDVLDELECWTGGPAGVIEEFYISNHRGYESWEPTNTRYMVTRGEFIVTLEDNNIVAIQEIFEEV